MSDENIDGYRSDFLFTVKAQALKTASGGSQSPDASRKEVCLALGSDVSCLTKPRVRETGGSPGFCLLCTWGVGFIPERATDWP